jgi:transposase
MKAYSMDLRDRVLAACDAGTGTKAAAERFGVCESWLRRLKQRRRELGLVGALPHNAGRKRALDEAGCRRLEALVAAKPDATLAQLRQSLGRCLSIGALWQTLRRLKLPLKKSRGTPPSRTAPTSGRSASGGRRK